MAQLPRSKWLLISWLQSPSAVILEPRKIKSDTVSTVSPSICYELMGPDRPLQSIEQSGSLLVIYFMCVHACSVTTVVSISV